MGGSTSKEALQMYQDLHVSRNATSTVVGSFSKQGIVEVGMSLVTPKGEIGCDWRTLTPSLARLPSPLFSSLLLELELNPGPRSCV